jgi:hypothetical protein
MAQGKKSFNSINMIRKSLFILLTLVFSLFTIFSLSPAAYAHDYPAPPDRDCGPDHVFLGPPIGPGQCVDAPDDGGQSCIYPNAREGWFYCSGGSIKQCQAGRWQLSGRICGQNTGETSRCATKAIHSSDSLCETTVGGGNGSVPIGCTLKLGNLCISEVFPSFGALFTNIVVFAMAAAALIFFFMLLWGGFRYLNAGGDPKNAEAARQTLTNAAVGLLIVVVSFVIIEVATRIIGVGSIFSP